MEFALKSLRVLGFRVLSVAALQVIAVLTARWMGPLELGIYATVVLYASIGVAFLGGMGSALAYEVSNLGRPLRQVVATALVLALGLGTLALLIAISVYSILGDPGNWPLVVVGAAQIPLLCGQALTWAFLGADDHRNYNRAIVAPAVLSLVALVVVAAPVYLADGEAPARLVLVSWLAAQCGVVVWLLWLGRRAWLPPAFDAVTPGALSAMFAFGLQTGIANVVSQLNYRVDMVALQVLRGLDDVGIYSVAVRTVEGLWFVSAAIGVAIYARVGMLPRDEAARLTARSMRFAIGIIAVLGLVLVAAAGTLLPLLYGSAYAAAVPAFRILVPGIVIFGLGQIFSTFFTNALGRPRVPLLIAAVSLAVSVPLCLVLIPLFGMNGAALATTISYSVSMGLAIALFSRETGIPVREVLLLTGDDLRAGQRAIRAIAGGLGRQPGRAVEDKG